MDWRSERARLWKVEESIDLGMQRRRGRKGKLLMDGGEGETGEKVICRV